jgi:eukaryotic-like serine/threonine-protein kinase
MNASKPASLALVSPARPSRVGPYEIVGKIGGGGMAAVFLGRKTDPDGRDRMAAVKVIRAELATQEQFVTMFADEAKILSRLEHRNISRTLEVGHADHLAFIAMELLLGRTLADTWDAARSTGATLPFDLVAWVCAEVARGLHYAHELTDEKGEPFHLIHRDVNPSNIFLTYDGAIKLFDFGLAMAQGRRSHTQSGVVKGKVAYLSPEQLVQVPLDRRSDIFSLGTTLWELTTMKRLFKRDNDLDSILAIRDGDVPDPSLTVENYPKELWEIVKRSLVTDRDGRYATAADLAADLEAFARSHGDGGHEEMVGVLLDRFFPGERNKQAAWLARTASMPANVGAATMMPPAPIVQMADEQLEVSLPLLLLHKK